MAHLAVNEKVLQWAIDRSGKTEAVLKSFPKLPAWMSYEGELYPDLKVKDVTEALRPRTGTSAGPSVPRCFSIALQAGIQTLIAVPERLAHMQ
jgi:hypothetical protein